MTVIGGIAGVVIGFITAVELLLPASVDLEAAAAELVPAGAEVTGLATIDEHPVIAGWDQFTVADFDGGSTPWPDLHTSLVERAQTAGWTVDDEATRRFGTDLNLTRGLLRARADVYARSRDGERVEAGAGSIRMETNELPHALLFWTVVAAGGTVGGAAAQWLSRRRRTPGPVSRAPGSSAPPPHSPPGVAER